MSELTPEGEVLSAHIAATAAAFQVLVRCLERCGALDRGAFSDALRQHMEAEKDRLNEMALALLDELRHAHAD